MAVSQNFPGVYIKVTDQSFAPQTTSRFSAGLVGVAEKGPFDQAISVRSLQEYIANFGRAVDGSYLAQAAAVMLGQSDGLTVVRVGRRYEETASSNASGSSGTSSIRTPNANLFSENDYIRITQIGKASTVNAKVLSVDTNTNTITLVSSGTSAVTLADTYTTASIDKSYVANAANEAESFLESYVYGSVLTNSSQTISVVGNRNAYEATLVNAPANLADILAIVNIGDLVKIEQSGKSSTREILVKDITPASGSLPAKIYFETSSVAETGYQPLPLQDNYTATGSASYIKKVTTGVGGAYVRTRSLHVLASSTGTWANTGTSSGLSLRVSPSVKADSKIIKVYLNGGLVETIDGVNFNSSSSDYIVNRINGKSAYINVSTLGTEPCANTLSGWNAGPLKINLATFSNGYNGEAASTDDYIGSVDPSDDSFTGLKIFEDTENIDVSVICVPGKSDTSIAQEGVRIARKINAVYLLDVPAGLNAREAVDWHNAEGLYQGSGKIDDYSCACYWNWFTITDPFTGNDIKVPPTVGALRSLAYTFDTYKPWNAAAGDTRGVISEATAVEFIRVSSDTLDSMYGNGNSVNPILRSRSKFVLFGERTMQRTESKMTALHNVILVNYIVKNLAILGRKYVFDPNDNILLSQIRESFTQFLDGVRNERGIEAYELIIDSSNNTSATRNAREVIVDLAVVPTDTMERMFINATVRESGAVLNTAQ